MISARAEVIGKTFAPKKVRGSKSPIWDFFTKIADKDGNISAASCICGVQLAFQVGWGTGHLTRHTNKCSIVLRSKARTIMSLEVGDDDDDDDFFPSLTMEEGKSRDGGGDGLTQSTLRFEKNEKKLHALPKIPYSQENAATTSPG